MDNSLPLQTKAGDGGRPDPPDSGDSIDESYDAVIVGSGLGGLTAASLLAASGRSVLVVERHDRVGGYAHSFQRHSYRFDSAVHLIGGCAATDDRDGGIVRRVIEAVGVADDCDFVRVDPFFRAYYPDFCMDIPSGLDAFIQAHADRFPAERDGILRLTKLCSDVRDETNRASSSATATGSKGFAAAFPALVRYHRATLADVLDDYISDPKLKSVLSTCWPYAGLPPSRVSFLYWSAMLISYIADGAYYCRGTFQRFAQALAGAVTAGGGRVLLSSGVKAITTDAEGVSGVVLDDDRRVRSRVVVSNADARQTIEQLVGEQHFPARYLRAHRRRRASISAFVVYIATDLALEEHDLAHETFAFARWDHDASFGGVERGATNWLSVTVPTLADRSLAPSDQHLLTLTTLVAHDAISNWAMSKSQLVDEMVVRAQALVSELEGLSDHLIYCEGASPFTMERYTSNSDGAIYGWELSPGQVGAGRPANRTPVAGLYLAGHWAQPGGGVYGVVVSGVEAAAAVLDVDRDELFTRLSV
jgi:prolycopene isomerase